MGWTVHEVKCASLWEFFAAWHGYVDANTSRDKAKLSDADAEDLFAWLEAGNDNPRALSTQTYWLDDGRLVPAGVVTFEVY